MQITQEQYEKIAKYLPRQRGSVSMRTGVLSRVFAALQTEGIIQINVEVVCLDSTSVKVHPDGTGALKKEENRRSKDHAEDSPRRFIWLPHLTDRLSAFRSPEEQNTTHRKE